MTVRAKNRVTVAGILIGIAALAATLLPIVASPNEPVRDIEVVVRAMTFYVDGSSEPNPAITLRAGEQVRITVRNEDPGMQHDFSIGAWTVGTKMLEQRGDEDSIRFRVPSVRGAETYRCTPHSTMMTGTIRIE
jgi:FtsP/CotA-like multicopper oxidase with cupredoxin domain